MEDDPLPQSAHYSAGGAAAGSLELVVPAACSGLRLDRAMAMLMPELSRSRLKAWIDAGRVQLNGTAARAKATVWGGERVRVTPEAAPEPGAHAAQDIPLDIVHEDAALIVIAKPAGMVVHPGSGNREGTLLNALLHHAPQLAEVPRAGIVHRLDKDTSGLLVVARTIPAQVDLVRQLQARTVKRAYLALVHGEVAGEGAVDAPVGRHPTARTRMAVVARGRPARTHYRVAERLPGCTLLECRLETGRTHQIRVHMQSIGHPLVGDPDYRGPTRRVPPRVREILDAFPRQALHAFALGLVHPATGRPAEWRRAPPADFVDLLERLRAIAAEGPQP